MKIFVTNLKGTDHRKNWMIKHLNKHNLEFEFIDCIDGRKWSEEEVKSIVSPKIFELHKSQGNWLTKGAIAATKTHIEKIYKRIWSKNIEYALCLEDDIVLTKNFKSSLAEVESILRKNNFDGVVLLHYALKQPTELSKLERIDSEKISLYGLNPDLKVSSGAGYIISRNAAKNLIDTQVPISRIADWWHHHPNLDVRIAYPMLINTGVFESTLGYKKSGLAKLLGSIVPEIIKRPIRLMKLRKSESKNIIV